MNVTQYKRQQEILLAQSIAQNYNSLKRKTRAAHKRKNEPLRGIIENDAVLVTHFEDNQVIYLWDIFKRDTKTNRTHEYIPAYCNKCGDYATLIPPFSHLKPVNNGETEIIDLLCEYCYDKYA